jgi:hypothetical protein
MDQASADEQKGSQGQRPEDIEFSPAPGVVKGGNSVRYTPVVPSEREQAALSAWAHAQRVSQGVAELHFWVPQSLDVGVWCTEA